MQLLASFAVVVSVKMRLDTVMVVVFWGSRLAVLDTAGCGVQAMCRRGFWGIS